jgi:hypothetical protein
MSITIAIKARKIAKELKGIIPLRFEPLDISNPFLERKNIRISIPRTDREGVMSRGLIFPKNLSKDRG